MKIFQIGFNKCGTNSICTLFDKYTDKNLKCVHWDEGLLAKTIKYNTTNQIYPILGKYNSYNVISDMEHSKKDEIILAHKDYFIQLDQSYPGAKFILNIRPIDNWIRSRLNHEQNHPNSYVDKYKKFFGLRSTQDVIDLWRLHWKEHLHNVKKYFFKRNNLLVYDIEKDNFAKFSIFFPELTFKINNLPKMNVTKNKKILT